MMTDNQRKMAQAGQQSSAEDFVEGAHSKTQVIEMQIRQALSTATTKLSMLNQEIEEAERENELLMAQIESAT